MLCPSSPEAVLPCWVTPVSKSVSLFQTLQSFTFSSSVSFILIPSELPAAATAAKSLQSCLTLCDPIDGSPPGSPVPGILQTRTQSGLPFPSPMQESEKWKWSRSVVSNSYRPHGLQPTRLLHPWDFPGKSTGVGCYCLLPLSYLLLMI